MIREPPSMLIVCLIAQQVKQLRIHDGDHKIEGIVCIADDDEHRCPSLAQHIQFQFIVGHQVAQLLDIEGCQPGSTGNQDGFRGFAGPRAQKI